WTFSGRTWPGVTAPANPAVRPVGLGAAKGRGARDGPGCAVEVLRSEPTLPPTGPSCCAAASDGIASTAATTAMYEARIKDLLVRISNKETQPVRQGSGARLGG